MQARVKSVQSSPQERNRQQILEQKRTQENLWQDYQQLWQLPLHHHRPEFVESIRQRWSQVGSWPIAKQPQDWIDVQPGGVIGDCHYYRPDHQRRYNEISTFAWEEIERLNDHYHRANPPGCMGENITTEGIELETLPRGTLLRIGTARVRVQGARSFCWKYVAQWCQRDLLTADDIRGLDLLAVGRALQCVSAGRIAPGDAIDIEYMGTERDPKPIPVFDVNM